MERILESFFSKTRLIIFSPAMMLVVLGNFFQHGGHTRVTVLNALSLASVVTCKIALLATSFTRRPSCGPALVENSHTESPTQIIRPWAIQNLPGWGEWPGSIFVSGSMSQNFTECKVAYCLPISFST